MVLEWMNEQNKCFHRLLIKVVAMGTHTTEVYARDNFIEGDIFKKVQI